jgi:ESS family glutamate:Na+ symporter
LYQALTATLVLAICVGVGDSVNRFLFSQGVLLPGFLSSMLVGIVITNGADLLRLRLDLLPIERMGEVSLNVFLAMSLMSIQLWTLAEAAVLVVSVLMAQMLVISLFVVFIVFRVMGRDYDACIMSAGFLGLGLGATPVAIANMDAVTEKYGPSPKAFLVVPLIGAFFVDLLNVVTIKFYIGVITSWLV